VTGPPTPARRRLLTALAVAAAAFALRAGFVLSQGAPAPLAGDAAEYRAYADSLAARGVYEGFRGDRATRMPGYPLFLAAAGASTRNGQWAQCFLGALTCAFLFLWTGAFLRPRWALACGLAAAAYYDLIAPSNWVLTEALYSCLLAGSFCALYMEELPLPARSLLGGLGFGLTALVRPEVLPFAGVILAAAPFLLKGFGRRHAIGALAVLLAFPSLWAARNARVLGRPVPTSTTSGFNLYCGLRLPLDRQGLDLAPMPSPAGGELERDAAYRRAFVELRRSVPAARRAKAYLFNLLTVYYPFLPEYDWTYVLLVPYWLFGLWIARRRRELLPAAGLVAGLSVIFAFLAGPVSRYRFGFAPCLLVLAGAGAQALYDRLGKKRFTRATAAWTAANLGVWLFAGPLRRAVLELKSAIWG
jgi:hypothetical protein